MEKLGIEKKQHIDELQAEYNRLIQREHGFSKEASAAPQRAALANEIEQIKLQLDALCED